MSNTVIKAQNWAGELDKALVQKSKTGFLADNTFKAKFVGAKTVLIPDIKLQGLGDYDRENGFVKGSIALSNTTYELSQDRGRTFSIDEVDVDETGISNLAGQIMGEFIRTQTAPETDAYNLSKLAGVANAQSHVYTTTTYPIDTKVYAAFDKMLTAINNAGVENEEIVCFVDYDTFRALRSSSEISRTIDVGSFTQGGINRNVKTIDGVSIIPVSEKNMKTAYVFNDGKDHTGESNGVDESAGGYKAAANAKNIKMLMLPKAAAMLVKKHEKTRIFTPDVNQEGNAYKFDYRLFYDVFVKTSYKDAVHALTTA